jgi:hypothetical protein
MVYKQFHEFLIALRLFRAKGTWLAAKAVKMVEEVKIAVALLMVATSAKRLCGKH